MEFHPHPQELGVAPLSFPWRPSCRLSLLCRLQELNKAQHDVIKFLRPIFVVVQKFEEVFYGFILGFFLFSGCRQLTASISECFPPPTPQHTHRHAHTYVHTYTHTHKYFHTQTHTQSPSVTHSLGASLSHTHTYTCTHPRSLLHTLPHTHLHT